MSRLAQVVLTIVVVLSFAITCSAGFPTPVDNGCMTTIVIELPQSQPVGN